MNLLLDYFKKAQIRQKNIPLLVHPYLEIHKQNRSCGDDCRVRLRLTGDRSTLSDPSELNSSASQSTTSSSSSSSSLHLDRDPESFSKDNPRRHMASGIAGKASEKTSINLTSDLQIEASGCAVHLASSEIALEVCQNLNKADALKLAEAVIAGFENRPDGIREWLNSSLVEEEKNGPTSPNLSLDPRIIALYELKDHPVRKKCVLLAWQTLYEALGQP